MTGSCASIWKGLGRSNALSKNGYRELSFVLSSYAWLAAMLSGAFQADGAGEIQISTDAETTILTANL